MYTRNIKRIRGEEKVKTLYLFSPFKNSQIPILPICTSILLILSFWDLKIGIYLGFGSI